MARTITPFKLRTELTADTAKHSAAYKKAEGEVTHYTDHLAKEGKKAAKAFDGAGAGAKFGKDFGASAVSEIAGSFSVSTLGGIIGTAVAPGIGTAVGSAIGSGIDTALSKVTPIVLQQIQGGIALNKLLEETKFEFKTFAGDEQEANKYLAELLDISKQVGILPQILIDASEKAYDLTGNLKLTRSILKAATDQAADFGGSVEVFEKVAESLGLIAEKGELDTKILTKLFRLGINAPKYLAEATGLSDKQIQGLIKAGRLRGDVAARLIAEGIERDKGGFAAARTAQTVAGRERQFGVLMQERAAEGTQNVTRAIGDFYGQADAILNSPQAKKVVEFIDHYAGVLVDFTEKGLKTGVSIGGGIAEGMLSFNPASMLSSFTKLQTWMGSTLEQVFDIRSPSHWSEKVVGIPVGEGIGSGTVIGFKDFMLHDGKKDILEFIQQIAADAVEVAKKTGVPASVTIAQGILESRAGQSGLTRRSKNLFGIKGVGPAGSVTMRTREVGPGGDYYVNAPFRAYNTFGESVADHARFLQGPRYRGALQYSSDPAAYAAAIKRAGYATDPQYASKVTDIIDKYGLRQFDVGGAPVSKTNPVPVYFVRDIIGGSSAERDTGTATRAVRDDLGNIYDIPTAQKIKDTVLDWTDDAFAAATNFTGATRDLVITTADYNRSLQPLMRTINPVIQAQYELANAQANHANTAIALTAKYQQTARDELIMGTAIMDKLQGLLGQAVNFIPGQEVGKKRGFWSKVLGFAAPFLSFIPGIGPIAATIAGAASNIAGGNYAGAVTGIAGGFASGGVFRSSPRVGSAGGTQGHEARPRAFGGPVTAGLPYIVGERGPELRTFDRDGWIHPAGSWGGHGTGRGWDALMERIAAALERNHAALDRFESMPANEVVRTGFRGVLSAMDGNADNINQMGRRLRLS